MRKKFEVYTKFSAILTISIGLIVLLGWYLDISVLKSMLPGLTTMKVNTAVCFILCGLSLLLFQVKPAIKIASYLKQTSALIATIVGALALCEYLFGWDLGIDQLLYKNSLARTDPSLPGRMAFITALNFLLIGLSLLLFYRGRFLRTSQVFLLIVVFNSLLALMGYAYGVGSLYGIYFYSTLALHTAILFVILAAGILYMRPEQGLMEIITSDTVGGVVVRRLLPAAVIVPFLMGWLRLLGERAGAYGFEFGLALFALSNIIVFAILVIWSGRHLHHLDVERERVKEELVEREKHYRALFNLSPSGIVLEDIEGNIFMVNESYCKSVGYSKEELIGRNIRMVASAEETRRIEDHIASLRSGKTLHHAIENIRKDGTECWMELHETMILLSDHREGILVIAHDISERKRAEEELLKIGTTVEQTADCVVITDKNGIIQYVNTAFTKIFGYSKEEALGKTPRILKSGLHPPEFYNTLWKTILSGEVFSATLINKRKDGELIYEIKTITPIKDKEGHITHFVSTAKEITEQKRAEQEIISQKNRFAQLFENSPVAIALLDDQDKIVQINESFSALFGFYLEEIIGKTLSDFIIPDEGKEEAEYFSDQTREGSQINKESYRKKKDGTLVFVNVIGIPIIINEKLVGIYGMYVDMAQRKEAEEKMRLAKELAEKSDRLKSEFLAQMSHEIRTPLNTVLNYTCLLKEEIHPDKLIELKDIFEGIDNSGSRIYRTIDLILNAAELQTGSYNYLPKQIDLYSEVIVKAVSELKYFASLKNLDIRINKLTDNTTIICDEYSIHQTFINLIDNAIKYSEKGFIEIRLLCNNNDKLQVEVEDTGIGMSEEFVKHLFEPFTQEETGYSRRFEGTGLGLSIVKKYCNLNNAQIGLKSIKGAGSTFTIVFNS